MFPTVSRKRRHMLRISPAGQLLLLGALLLSLTGFAWYKVLKSKHDVQQLEHEYLGAPVLISYAYYEKDLIQAENFEFFIKAGTLPSPTGQELHWVFVSSTDACTPCQALPPSLRRRERQGPVELGVKRVSEAGPLTLIFRVENAGMDIGSHNVSLSYMMHTGRLWHYRYFILINSSAKGPFYPAYMPPAWHWVHAYLARFAGEVHAVASSLVCLPDLDAGGPGPRLESWAYAVDSVGLRTLMKHDALQVRYCKHCESSDGIIVGGEYGISRALLAEGLNFATLMAKYDQGVDWRRKEHWGCNNNVHPSRHGTYDGIAFHPYETVFVKASWHVADPYTSRYAAWRLAHLSGRPGTEGRLDRVMYRYAISEEAQAPNLLELSYNVSKYRQFFQMPLEHQLG